MSTLDKVRGVIEQIYAQDYYIRLWEGVKHQKPLEECSEDELLEPFQNFWKALPDHRAIHRPPFSAICDLAELYCFGDEE